MIRYTLLAVLCGVLVACGGPIGPQTTVRVVTSMTWPELPPLEPLPALDLLPFKYDYPRDGAGKIIPNSNIYVGFDRQNWTAIQENFLKLDAREKMFKVRIDEVNRQRKEWLAKAKAEQAKVN